jgi:hypothetical protein
VPGGSAEYSASISLKALNLTTAAGSRDVDMAAVRAAAAHALTHSHRELAQCVFLRTHVSSFHGGNDH